MFTSGGTAPSYPTGWEAKKYTAVKFDLVSCSAGRRLPDQSLEELIVGLDAAFRLERKDL